MLLSSWQKVKPHSQLKFEHSRSLKHIPEPSGIAYDSTTDHLFIVSDHGILFECDNQGNILRRAEKEGMDFEGVEIKDSFVYVSDESPRKVYQYRKSDLSLVKEYSVSWGGAINKAFESITYNHIKNCFLLVSQSPVVIVEYDTNFHETKRFRFRSARDISDAKWYNGSLYLLSALDETIFKCDPTSYEIKESFKINILNPEGLAFDREGNLIITSDDMQKIYFFKNLPHN